MDTESSPAVPAVAPCGPCGRIGDNASPASLPKQSWYEDKKLLAKLDLFKTLIVVFGVPVGLYTFADNKMKERHEAEWMAYEKMDDRYWTYERLAMDHPLLSVSDVHASDPALAKLAKPRDQLTPEERIHERQMMYMLIAMYERAFILYSDKSTDLKENQWAGWKNGLKRWCKAPAFREAWQHIGEDFDRRYQVYVNQLLQAPLS